MDTFSEWYEDLAPAIAIKVEDFHILGYREIKASHIWAFLTEEKWKNEPTLLCMNVLMMSCK